MGIRRPSLEAWQAALAAVAIVLLALLSTFCSGVAGQSEWNYAARSPEEFRRVRAQLRAYDGAPPVIPHEVAALGRQECLSCHQPGSVDNGDRIAPPRSHPAWGDCRQCHVERKTTSVYEASSLQPLRWPSKGSRQSELSPPTIPHTLQNRQDCAVCHIGAQAHPVLRAAHGLRPNCKQCHVASVQIAQSQ